MSEVDKVQKFYEAIEPIAELIEANKEKISLLMNEIEDDINTTPDEMLITEHLESALLDLSFSGGDTSLNDLKELLEAR